VGWDYRGNMRGLLCVDRAVWNLAVIVVTKIHTWNRIMHTHMSMSVGKNWWNLPRICSLVNSIRLISTSWLLYFTLII
jgi:hypothetical protein